MLKTSLLILIFCGFAFAGGDSLKVMTYNIEGMKPGTEPEVRIVHIIDKLIEIDADIIGLQEINESLNSSGMDNQAKVIADSLSKYFGIPYYFYNQFTHLSWNNQFREFIGIITKYPVEQSGFFQLVTGTFPRKVVWNKITTPLGTVNFFNTHLSFNSSTVRIQQVQQIISYIKSIELDHPAIASILTGDFNDTPNTTTIQRLTNTGTDTFFVSSYAFVNPGSPGYTVPSNAPTSKIDYVFIKNTGKITPFESAVVMNQPYNGNSYCSDHLGVLTSFNENVVNVDDGSSIYPNKYNLFQNYPNPFNPTTTISYEIYKEGNVTLKIFDFLGREIENIRIGFKPVGFYKRKFDASNLPSGVYFYRLTVNNFTSTKKMILLQ
jgi:endonuclease/exonuclease/phosphatase family metal-dependent hydrolase